MKALDVKIGSNPISSANDDLSELGADTPLEPSCRGQRDRLARLAGGRSQAGSGGCAGLSIRADGFPHLSELKRSLER